MGLPPPTRIVNDPIARQVLWCSESWRSSVLTAGAALLSEDSWSRRQELAFGLELRRAECESLTGALQGLLIGRMANLSLEHGHCDGTSIAYVWPGMMLGPYLGDLRAAFRFGKVGLDLVENRGLDGFRARVYLCLANFVNTWAKHVRTSRELQMAGVRAGDPRCDLTFVAYGCNSLITNLLAAGEPLGDVEREAEDGLALARRWDSDCSSTSSRASSGSSGRCGASRRASPPSATPSSTRAVSSGTWSRTRASRPPPAGTGSARCSRACSRETRLRPRRGGQGRAAPLDLSGVLPKASPMGDPCTFHVRDGADVATPENMYADLIQRGARARSTARPRLQGR
jgi:hypothetical protein